MYFFLKPSKFNEKWKKAIYYPNGILLSFLTLDHEISVLEKKETYNFDELSKTEFPSDSERIVEQMNQLRKKILSYYSF